MDQIGVPTNSIKINRDLRDRFDDCIIRTTPDGCILTNSSTIEVELIGSRERVSVSILRVAFMLGHAPTWANWRQPWEHLTEFDFAVHICMRGRRWKQGEPICINWEHLRKGTHKDIATMKRARRRSLIMQEVQS